MAVSLTFCGCVQKSDWHKFPNRCYATLPSLLKQPRASRQRFMCAARCSRLRDKTMYMWLSRRGTSDRAPGSRVSVLRRILSRSAASTATRSAKQMTYQAHDHPQEPSLKFGRGSDQPVARAVGILSRRWTVSIAGARCRIRRGGGRLGRLHVAPSSPPTP